MPDQLPTEPLADLPAENPDWARLGVLAGNPFATWEWASAWWRQYGKDREQRILGCRDTSGELIGVVPLYVASQRPLRILRFVGNGPADQLGPVCLPEQRTAVVDSTLTALRGRTDWDVLVAERLAESEGWPQLLGGITTRLEPSPAIVIQTDDWDQFLAGYSSNFRSQVRRYERGLAREHELSFRLADGESLETDMTTLFRLHEERWGASPQLCSPRSQAMHREFARAALAGGWLRLTILELDGLPAAAIYVFRLGGVDWFYQSGRDPQLERKRVGAVLLNHAIREAVEAGMGEFKLLTGVESYKSRYTDVDRPVQTVAVSRNAMSKAGVRLSLITRRARAAVRARGA